MEKSPRKSDKHISLFQHSLPSPASKCVIIHDYDLRQSSVMISWDGVVVWLGNKRICLSGGKNDCLSGLSVYA